MSALVFPGADFFIQAAGLLAGVPIAYLGWKALNPTVTSPVKPQTTEFAMPGLYPACR
jgi:hypothetical protein